MDKSADIWRQRAELARRLAYSLPDTDCSELLRYAEECDETAAQCLLLEKRHSQRFRIYRRAR